MKFLTKLFSTLLLSATTLHAMAAPQELDRVRVIVNDGVILQSEIDMETQSLIASASQSGQSLPGASVLQEQILDKLIVEKIQLQEAERVGIRIDDNRLASTLQEIAKNNQKSLEQFRQHVESQGLSWQSFREQIRDEVAQSEVRNALVRQRINILPAEVDNLADILAQESGATITYKIAHIQLRFNEDEDKSIIEQQANELTQRLKQGEDFATMAITYSKGPKALEGGDWGWMRKEEMPTIFADQIALQSKGEIIGPFRSGIGFHILKIEDVKGLETVSVTEVNARHILIKPTVILSDTGVQRELTKITQRIQSGEVTFADMAEQYSQDPGSAVQGGKLGYQTPELYVPEFKHQVETLPVGVISQPFKTVHGWHIVEVLDRRDVDKTGSAMQNRAYRILFNRKFNEEASAWLQELRASAFVEMVNDDE
ncbi:peptidylprolyl isomerase SurA [Vibrio hippocampi]|uniref:Chaperone SurA n=1 Tax=Vibrio hippocampi TaxID=654686 RepID=A0ABN8DGT5_9VIBR|nr:peptidylprolyl isomerase SurA [Vibrio hippocampi]CAH0526834.1 Chaperone SurA [Vibrio hippocampi]